MSGTLKDGYYNYDNHTPGCWLVEGGRSWFVKTSGAKEPEDFFGHRSTLELIREGTFVPSLWLPPGVTHNPAMGLDPKYQGRFTKKGFAGLVWFVQDDQVMYKYLGDTDKSRDYPTLEAFKDAVDRGELFRVEADEPTRKAVPFDPDPFDPDPFDSQPPQESLEDTEAASRFINLEAMEAVSYIALECSWKADDQVRRVFTTPSQLDRAIAARVVELLS